MVGRSLETLAIGLAASTGSQRSGFCLNISANKKSSQSSHDKIGERTIFFSCRHHFEKD